MKFLTKTLLCTLLLSPGLLMAANTEEMHNHNHFNPELEALGDDIISLTVCYKNGYLSDEDQEPAFKNLIDYAGVEGEELGMYYMNELGMTAEKIMSSDDNRLLWTQDYCTALTQNYLDEEALKAKKWHNMMGDLMDDVESAELLKEDIERGKLLQIN